ncbi:hypothetical protein KA013_01790 [Patescibacteria group bacterium]|jgi:hypothetical protein|nr:hypothetical protein [Patescibacteria group bacterium]
MQQLRLVTDLDYNRRSLQLDQVKATFTKVANAVHEVVLEINSHKFLIQIKAGLKSLEHFEIIAVKGFIELGMKIVRLLKNIVTKLYFEY